MNKRIIILSIIISMIVSSLSASGLHIETESENDCGCNGSEDNNFYLNQQGEYACGLIEPTDWQENAPFDLCVPIGSLTDEHDWRDYGKNVGHPLELKNVSRKQLMRYQLIAYFYFYLLNFRLVDLSKLIVHNWRVGMSIIASWMRTTKRRFCVWKRDGLLLQA